MSAGFRFSVFGFRSWPIFKAQKTEKRKQKTSRFQVSWSVGQTKSSGLEPSALISIIIPTLNEGEHVGRLLAGLPPSLDVEFILVDGGSTDDTLTVAAAFPHVQALTSSRGRGLQMNMGAIASKGEILVFLHADTQLEGEHLNTLRRVAADPGFAAGAFEFSLRPDLPALRLIARGVNWRCRYLGLPYGDQALSVRRGLFFALGGFAHRRPEDLDLVLRLKRTTRLRLLSPPVPTSGRRWLKEGYFKTTLKNWLFLACHLLERTFTHRCPELGELESVGGGGGQGAQPPPLTP